jgi:two-component system sensor histidine kinase/response regulator
MDTASIDPAPRSTPDLNNSLLSLLKATLESTVDGILVVTRDRNTPVYNQKFLQMWGLSESLMQPGMADERLKALSEQTRDPEGFIARIWELFRDRPTETVLDTLEFKDGRIFERYSQPLWNGDQVIGRVWSFRDVAERRRNEQALQQQATAIKASIDGIAILDANETYVYLNDSHARIYGYDTVQELIGKSWKVLYTEAEQQRLEREAFPVFQQSGHWQGEAIGRRRDGSAFPQEISFSATQTGGLVCIVRDISQRKQAEEALRRSESRFRLLYEATGLAVLLLDENGFFDCNQAAADLLGYPRQEIVGKYPSDLSPPYQMDGQDSISLASQLTQLTLEQGSSQFEWIHQRPDGTQFPVEVWLTTITVDDRSFIQAIIQDLTERKQVEAALAEQASLEAFRADVDSALAQSDTLPVMLQRCTAAVVVHLNAAFARIWILNPEENVLELKASAGMYTRLDGTYSRIPVGSPKIGRIAQDHQPIITNQIQNESQTFDPDWVSQEGFVGFASYPLMLGDQFQGVIAMFSRKPITDSIAEALGFAASEIALGICRKRAEAALRESELKFRTIVENANDIIYVHDSEGKFTYVSPNVTSILGYTPAEVEQHSFMAIAHPDDIEQCHPVLQRVVTQGEKQQNLELRIRHRDGSWRWFSCNESPIQDADGQVMVMGVARDSSDRKQLEAELRQSQQFLDSIINNIPLALFTKDIQNDFRYVLINQNSDQILGFPRAGAIGKNDHDLLSKELADAYREQDQTAVDQGTLLEIPDYPIQTREGTILARSMKLPLFDSQGNPTYLLCISEDITERKRQEEALQLIVEGTAAKTGDDFFRTCVHYLAEVLQVHCAFVTEWANEQHTRVRLLAMWLGGAFSDNFEFDLCGTPCENVVKGQNLYFYPEDVPILFPNDPYIPLLQAESYLGIPLRDTAGKMLGYLAVTDNKPMKPDPGRELILKVFAARAGAELERKQSETALMVAKEAAEAANRAKSTFLANMSHELRTPLNAILGFTQLMVRDPTLAVQQRRFLETINRSGEHLLMLINDVLEMSKIEAGRTVLNPDSFDLHLLLHTVYEMFQERAERKHLVLEFDRSADLPQHVIADEGKLRQILINLLSNGIKFTQAGRVSLSASVLSRQGNIEAVQGESASNHWVLYFEVEDTGIGISPNELENLFQPFVQTSSGNQSREGTGLGLAISQQFVQLMGGSIGVTSTLGQGSVFSFDVPVLLADPASVPAPAVSRQVVGLAPNQPTYRILVVDDRPENRDLVTQLLLNVGFAVRTASNGQEAIAQWQAWHPHLIWMDMRMPVMDGYEATRRIRDIESRVLLCVRDTTKIIALTASAFDEQQSIMLAAGCDDLVIKPFREAVIFEKMATHLGVQYIYAEEPQTDTEAGSPVESPIPVPPFTLSPDAFHAMPLEWVNQLQQAALAVDGDQIRHLIAQIPESDRPLAEALAHLVQQYQFDEILELTQGMD